MNSAFRRGQAVDSLESLAFVIVEYIVLTVCFPQHDAFNHWEGEIRGFAKAVKRLDKGKKGRTNFNPSLLQDILNEIIFGEDEKEALIAVIEASKGMEIGETDKVDWEQVVKRIEDFSRKTLV
jgi:hypothetical protein